MKKKVLLFIILLVMVCLVGCNETIKETIAIKHETTILNSEQDIINISISIKNSSLITEKNNIEQFDVYYDFEVDTKEKLLKANKIDNPLLKTNEVNVYEIPFSEDQYSKTLNVLFAIKLSEDGYIYSTIYKANITIMAREELEKNSEHVTAKRIVDYLESIGAGNIIDPSKIQISEINLQVDFNKKTNLLTFETNEYKYTYSNPNYDKITIIIYIKDEYALTRDFILIVNEKTIDSSRYKIENNVITYIFEDPNWTQGIY